MQTVLCIVTMVADLCVTADGGNQPTVAKCIIWYVQVLKAKKMVKTSLKIAWTVILISTNTFDI